MRLLGKNPPAVIYQSPLGRRTLVMSKDVPCAGPPKYIPCFSERCSMAAGFQGSFHAQHATLSLIVMCCVCWLALGLTCRQLSPHCSMPHLWEEGFTGNGRALHVVRARKTPTGVCRRGPKNAYCASHLLFVADPFSTASCL